MVYILTNPFCPIVDKVIDWLLFYEVDFVRINDFITEFEKLDYLNDLDCFKKGNDFYWIYRASSRFTSNLEDKKFDSQVYYEYIQGFFKSLDKNKTLGEHLNLSIKSKFEILLLAKQKKLNVPKTIITNKKKHVLVFKEKFSIELITKSCHDMNKFSYGHHEYISYTRHLEKSDLLKLSDNFGISLFQEKIEVFCEVKIFYLDGEIFPQAIFTNQKNFKDKIQDFRSNLLNNNSTTIQIPFDIRNCIYDLMNHLEYKIGVLDFLLDYCGKFYFLEINTEGIFEDLNYTGNYSIEKKIADYIIKNI